MRDVLLAATVISALAAVPLADRATAQDAAPTGTAPALTAPSGNADGADPAGDDAPPAMDEGAPVPTSPAATGALAPSDPESAETIVETDPDLWIGKPIVSADGVAIGSVEDVQMDAAGVPEAVTTSVGGFLGFGSQTVQLPVDPADFDGSEVRVGMVETDINALATGDEDTPAGAGLATSADELR
ncbi:PRC-barrel domain-containing protein [Mongoliimonas terrestris]|uniref:PRC-barrel domain-containing protein n=1 Tax=Mongoliimonas terrestris TaxID=1709001 RepID=UPI0009498CF2|nr:PRC-barrel domain-containing protein [Mongoliimonas terrestris]